MATTPTGLAAEDALVNARALLSQATLNDSQRAAVALRPLGRSGIVQIANEGYAPPARGAVIILVIVDVALEVAAFGMRHQSERIDNLFD